MVTEPQGGSKVLAFIHDLGAGASSPTFAELDRQLVVSDGAAPSPGVLLFRNHIQAAVLGYLHVKDLITPTGLAAVARAALEQLLSIEFADDGARAALQAEYRSDAERAVELLEKAPGERHADGLAAIRGQLQASFAASSPA